MQNLTFSKVLAALAAVAVFAQTGVTALPLDDSEKAVIVFLIGMASVFLASITGGKEE